MGLVISTLGLAIVGCGTSTGKVEQQNQAPTSNTLQDKVTNPEPKAVYLTPVPKGTPLITANGSEKAFEVRLRGSSFPPIGDWYFPNIVEPF